MTTAPDNPPPAWRAPLVGALLTPVGAFCAVYGYTIIQAIHWSQQSLKLGPVFLLFVTVCLNGVVRTLHRRLALTQSELALVYTMLVIATAIGGIGMVQFHVTGLPAVYYFATGANNWARFHPFIPAFFAPQDPEVIASFFKGNATLYSAPVLRAWALPVLFWSGFLFLLSWTMLCINALIRRQWVDGERLTFPLVQLPLEMVRDGGGGAFWKDRLMWAGFIIAGVLESVDSLNYLNPQFPYIQIKAFRIESSFPSPPWNGIGTLALAFYPFMIGIAYLLTLDVSFSCWFFYLFTKAEMVLATAAGWKDAGGGGLGRAPFLAEQGAGAFIGLALFALWTARGPLGQAWRDAVRGAPRRPGEVMSYRAACLGAFGGIFAVTLLWAWCGLSAWIALALFALYFLFQITITRIVVEAGAGWHFAPTFNPHQILFATLGMQGFGPRDLTMLAYLGWIDMDYRDSPMPHQLEGMRLAQSTGAPMNRVLWALLIAAAIGALSAYWANLHIYYEYGASTAKVRPWITSIGQQPLRQLKDWMSSGRPPDYTSLQAALAGMGAVSLLGMARQRFVWWPLHPIGYAVANTQSMEYMWLPFMIAWGLKAVVLRYGGMQLYRRSLPFFLGLILGDYIVPALWFVFGWCINTQMYMVFPH